MEILVNARFLTQKITGVQRFAIEIARQLKLMMPSIAFVAPANIIHHQLATELGVSLVGKLSGTAWEQIELPFYLKKNGNPLLINFCNTGVLFYRKQIVTIHDMSYKVNPAWFSKKFYKWYSFLIPYLAKNSVKILTVSNSSKNDIIKYLGVAPGKICVIYNSSSLISNTAEAPLRTRDRYLLTISSLDPRKNLNTLIKALRYVDADIKLVIVGLKSDNFNSAFDEELITDRIIVKGYVTDEELVTLMKAAEAFIYISLYEGFGLPPLEAMQLGCPVIVSDIAAHKEVCGDATLYVNPNEIDDVKNKINLLIANDSLQKKLIAAGSINASRFSWTNSAQKIITIINELV